MRSRATSPTSAARSTICDRSAAPRCTTPPPRPRAGSSERPASHKAIVILTDGIDTSSAMSSAEVSGVASSIDVPVYVVATVPAIDQVQILEAATHSTASDGADLRDLADWTGGQLLLPTTPRQRDARVEHARRAAPALRARDRGCRRPRVAKARSPREEVFGRSSRRAAATLGDSIIRDSGLGARGSLELIADC